MVNPYANALRQHAKPQIQLGQSQALKKFEKFNAKYSSNPNAKLNQNKQQNSDEDDDSLIMNIKASSKKFIKKKPEKQEESDSDSSKEQSLTESKHSEISIDFDRSSTPVPPKRQSLTKIQHVTHIPYSNRSASRIRSAASSVSSIRSVNKRSVKFVKTDSDVNSSNYDNDQSTEIEDMLSKNLILDIDDLEAPSIPTKKHSKRDQKISKSPLGMTAQKQSESVTSIREDDEFFENNESSESDKSLSRANNLIMDINELEKSLSKTDNKPKPAKEAKKKSKHKHDESTSTIKTESITDDDGEEIEQPIKSISNEKISSKREKSKKKKHLRSYASDFDDATSVTYKKKETTAVKSTQNAEIQVDPTDLIRNGHILNSISCFNPSSILLASTAYLNNETTLKDLNQISGYTMINKAFNDLIKMNVVFINNFLITQRNLYEEQLKSIQPKEAHF